MRTTTARQDVAGEVAGPGLRLPNLSEGLRHIQGVVAHVLYLTDHLNEQEFRLDIGSGLKAVLRLVFQPGAESVDIVFVEIGGLQFGT